MALEPLVLHRVVVRLLPAQHAPIALQLPAVRLALQGCAREPEGHAACRRLLARMQTDLLHKELFNFLQDTPSQSNGFVEGHHHLANDKSTAE